MGGKESKNKIIKKCIQIEYEHDKLAFVLRIYRGYLSLKNFNILLRRGRQRRKKRAKNLKLMREKVK